MSDRGTHTRDPVSDRGRDTATVGHTRVTLSATVGDPPWKDTDDTVCATVRDTDATVCATRTGHTRDAPVKARDDHQLLITSHASVT